MKPEMIACQRQQLARTRDDEADTCRVIGAHRITFDDPPIPAWLANAVGRG
jgi:hypothetical protein